MITIYLMMQFFLHTGHKHDADGSDVLHVVLAANAHSHVAHHIPQRLINVEMQSTERLFLILHECVCVPLDSNVQLLHEPFHLLLHERQFQGKLQYSPYYFEAIFYCRKCSQLYNLSLVSNYFH